MRVQTRSLTALAVLAISLAGCGGGASSVPSAPGGGASRALASTDAFTYGVSPFVVDPSAADMADPSALTPTVCEATYGLACYTPRYIRKGYDVPASATGAGRSIAIIDAYGSPTIASDVAVFSSAFGLPPANLNIIYPGGAPDYNPLQQHGEAGWAGETSLDVEWAHAIAPAATINLVVAANNAGDVLDNAVKYAIDNHLGDVITMSYGAPEAAIRGGGNNLQLIQSEKNFAAANAAGITLLASAGDNGASQGYATANALYPASSPSVTAVGGTNVFINDAGVRTGEYTWNDADPTTCPFGCRYGAFGATGGAPSAIFPAPAYQAAVSGNTARTTSDVAYNASVYTAVLVYTSFPGNKTGFHFYGGTSEGAPQWAGIVADAAQVAGHSLGQINQKVYAARGVAFNDITVGNNRFPLGAPGFPAGTGYDLPTGVGSPDVAKVISALQ